jgi:Protein of unknown function (DUF4232)
VSGKGASRLMRTVVGAMLSALLLGGTALAQPISPPIQLPPGACTAAQLAPGFVDAQGAAGTQFDTLQLVNISGLSCTLNGFVTVQMLDASSAPMPTIDLPAGGMLGGFPGPSPFVLPPGAATQFVIAWSDVPVGSETTCAAAAHLALTPPGGATAVILDIPPPAVAPCNSGTIDVGPLRAPGISPP